jgi:hypothetical protein
VKPRCTLPLTTSSVVAAALLLTACGGGGGSGDKKIKGAQPGSPSASASASSSAPAGPKIDRPTMTLPSDLKIVTSWTAPTDPNEAAALNDAVNYLTSIDYGVAKQQSDSGPYRFYSVPLSNAWQIASRTIKDNVDDGETYTGTERITKPDVQMEKSGKTAVVSLCVDDSKAYSKKIKTQKVLKTKPSLEDYTLAQISMKAATDLKGLWRAQDMVAKGSAKECM